MKTNGQILYEYKAPKYIKVARVADRHFATADDVLTIPNPVHHTPWNLLTQACRDGWEKTAVGHHIFSKVES